MKKHILLAISFSVLLTKIAFAHSIPGVTEPYDPPNYYSKESVSITDSAPSPFALKDLAANGYIVHDVTNNKKDIVARLKTYTEYLNVAKQYLMDLSDLFHTDDYSDKLSPLKIQLQELSKVYDKANVNDINKYLYTYETSKNIPLNEKYSYLSNVYNTALDTAKNAQLDTQDKQEVLVYAINTLNNASSEMQGRDALGTMEMLKQLELLKQQQLINQITTVEVMSEKAKKDEDYRVKNSNLKFFNLYIEDPYNPSEYYKENYEKEKAPGKGFVDFE